MDEFHSKACLLYEAFGWTAPYFHAYAFAFRKRWQKTFESVKILLLFSFTATAGIYPKPFVNFLTLMGYSMPGDQEIYNLEEIVKEFDYKRIGVSGAVFDVQKLDWINQQYLIKNIPVDQLWDRLKDWSLMMILCKRLMPLIHSRIKTFGDFMDLCRFSLYQPSRYTNDALFAVKEVMPRTILLSFCKP